MSSFDILIRGATVIDGTGRPGRVADVGIRGRRVEAVGDLGPAQAAQTVEAAGRVLCPGFIDIHTHSDLTLLEDPRGQSKIRQGVTTEVIGHCGMSPFPVTVQGQAAPARTACSDVLGAPDWTDLAGYARRVALRGSTLNIVPLVGHGTVRAAVMGYEDRPPRADELRRMEDVVAQAMDQGAFGLSAGLTLAPGRYAETDELVALCRVVARHGGVFDVHGRFWADWHLRAAQEAIDIADRSGAALQIAHLAIIDPRYSGRAADLLEVIDKGARAGVDVSFDVYPYTAAGSPLSQLLPGWLQEGGLPRLLQRLRDPAVEPRAVEDVRGGWFGGIPWAWDTVVVAAPGPLGDPAWTGRTVQEIADEWNVEPALALLRLIERSEDGIRAVLHNRTEEDMQAFLRHPSGMVGSDGNAIAADGPYAQALVHPRYYGAHVRVLGRYVRDLGVLSLEEAVHKMTAAPAARLGLSDRGLVAPGRTADLVLFDPAAVGDRATFEAPHQYAAGVPHVMVAGQWVVRDGEHTGVLPAGVLERPSARCAGG